MSNIHDFWSGRTSIPPGLTPALPRHAAAGQCIPQRNRLTGAYQPPAAVWMEQVTTVGCSNAVIVGWELSEVTECKANATSGIPN